MFKELLGVVLAPADDTLSTLGMALHEGDVRNCICGWTRAIWALSPFLLMGVVIALIDCVHQSFTYLNEFLVAVGHRDLDKLGSTVHIFLFLSQNCCDSLVLAFPSKYT